MTNPFSTKFWASGAIPYQFSECSETTDTETLDTLLEQADRHRVCQIVGPHGSGKSTLLLCLRKRYETQGNNVRYLCFNDQQRHLPNDFPFPQKQILLVDGYEQLPLLARLKLRFRATRLILTVHRPVWLVPILYRTEPHFSIFAQLVRQLVTESPEESTLRAAYDRSGGNFRNAFFELYDQWEMR
jgi:energy-coupling factor transporter ATP-binding protein EcfA2